MTPEEEAQKENLGKIRGSLREKGLYNLLAVISTIQLLHTGRNHHRR